MIKLKFVLPFTALSFREYPHSSSAILAVAVCIVVGTLFEHYARLASIDGTGNIPVLVAIAVAAAVPLTGFMLLRRTMYHNQLIKA